MLLKTTYLETIDFVRQLWTRRSLIAELTRRDFKVKYSGNIFGISWAVVEPLAMMVILWIVFTYLRAGQDTGVPFSLFLLTGIIAYDFFNKGINASVKSLKTYSFLIQKVNFRIAIIPIVKIICELFIHLIVLAIVVVIMLFIGQPVTWYWLQVFYYMMAAVVLLIGVSWATSSIALFFPDIQYIVTIVMRLAFFFTPIFWNPENIPEKYIAIIRLNPLYYLVTGYRDSLLFGTGFWEKPQEGLIFWSVSLLFLIAGIIVFKRLRPHFADVI